MNNIEYIESIEKLPVFPATSQKQFERELGVSEFVFTHLSHGPKLKMNALALIERKILELDFVERELSRIVTS